MPVLTSSARLKQQRNDYSHMRYDMYTPPKLMIVRLLYIMSPITWVPIYITPGDKKAKREITITRVGFLRQIQHCRLPTPSTRCLELGVLIFSLHCAGIILIHPCGYTALSYGNLKCAEFDDYNFSGFFWTVILIHSTITGVRLMSNSSTAMMA